MDSIKKTPSVIQAPDDVSSGTVHTPPSTIDATDDIHAAVAQYVPGTKLEKRLVRKIDFFMIPTLWLMCVLAYIDRNNIGNARAAGMGDDLDLTSNRYSMLISVFFIGYVVIEIPSNLILARIPPSWYLPGLMIAWGALVAGMSQVQSYKGILIFRFFLGVIEAGFMPGVMFIMSCWYKKDEIGKRFSIFFTALCIAGAVSGLLSGAIISGLEGSHGMTGWRWLFLLEGVITIGVATVCKFILPDYPLTSHRLSPEERQLAAVRIMHDKAVNSSQARKKMKPLQAIVAAAVDLRTYFFTALYLLDNGCATINYFVPTVLHDMGYGGVSAQWMTVPVWIVATVIMIIVSLVSDRTGDRRWPITFGFVLAVVSSIIIVTVNPSATATRYAFICFYISGVYCAFPLILTWTSETMSLPTEKRAVAIAIVNMIGNLAAIYGSYMWPTSDAPEYTRGFVAMCAMCAAGAIIAASLPIVFRYLPKFTTKAERELEAIEGQAMESA